MILTFLRERKSWIFFLIAIQLFMLLIGYLDPKIPLSAMLYIILLTSLASAAFISFRYYRETRFFKRLDEWLIISDSELPEMAESPFQQLVEDAVNTHMRQYRETVAQHSSLLDESKDELLSWIHEIKTPLTAMQLMIERISDPDLQRQLMYEWLRMHHLLDQQLHLKRLPLMQNDLFIEQVGLGALLNAEIRSLRSWCISKGIGFDIDLQAEEVLSDNKWLGFILRQLLANAVKYSEQSDIHIASKQSEDHVLLIITDNGRGIATKDLPRIFDKGFTSTTARQEGGSTGMGLYLAKQAASKLQILLEVTSTVDVGTTITLHFPRTNDWLSLTSM